MFYNAKCIRDIASSIAKIARMTVRTQILRQAGFQSKSRPLGARMFPPPPPPTTLSVLSDKTPY